MNKISSIILIVLTTTYCCAQKRTMASLTELELVQFEEYLGLDSLNMVHITDEHEPGTQLIICGTLVKKENGKPIPNQSIYLYQTDNTGEYNRQTEEDATSARLNGTVMTNKQGRFMVKTILPGDYVTHPDTRHIHSIIEGTKSGGHDFYFEQFVQDYLRRTVENDDQHYLIDLKKNQNGTVVGFITLETKAYE